MAEDLIRSGRRICPALVDDLTNVAGGLRSWINSPHGGPRQISGKCGDEARKGGCSLPN